MKLKVLLLAVLAVLTAPATAFAMAHSYGVAENLAAYGVPMSVGLKIGIMVDNLIHFFDHIVLTTQIFIQDPASSLMVLDGIGEACFSQVPPASHMFFSTGVAALLTTLVTYALMSSLLLFAVLRIAKKSEGMLVRKHQLTIG